MTTITNKNIREIQEALLIWFKENGRVFPWRAKQLTPYQIIVAETLLQRTKAETVSKFYSPFIENFPNWQKIADTEIETIEKHLKPIGLHKQRAKRLHSLAIEMLKRNEEIPINREELNAIPFIGQYIANSIELLIHMKSSPLLDVNMARLIERYFGKRKIVDIRYDTYLQSLAVRIVNHSQSKQINWAILDYAALVCKIKNPICKDCLIRSKCLYFKSLK